MSEILNQTYYGNTLIQWVTAMLIILASVILSRVTIWMVGKIVKNLEKQFSINLENIVGLVRRPVGIVIILIGFRIAAKSLNLPEFLANGIEHSIMFVVALVIAWALSNCIDYIEKTVLLPLAQKTETDFDDALLAMLSKSLKIIVWTVGIIVGLNNAGYDIGAVLAGLGIGGLALAMASQDSVANVFGGLTVFIQKPFVIGDRIEVAGIFGNVKDIGLRSTLISDFYGNHYTVPNKKFIDNVIKNIETRTAYWMSQTYRLHHSSTTDQIRKAMELLRKISQETEHVADDSFPNFTKIGEYFFEIDYWYAIDKWVPEDTEKFPFEYEKKIQVGSALHLSILEAFRKNGIKLAMPIWFEEFELDANNKKLGPIATRVVGEAEKIA